MKRLGISCLCSIAVVLGLSFLAPDAAAQPKGVRARVGCAPTGEELRYRCTITLADRQTGTPITGARVVINADMPAHPMVHHIKPIEARPGTTPGTYEAEVALEMAGRWALKITVGGPVVEQLVHVQEFGTPAPGKHH